MMEKILIVDDEPALRQMLGLALLGAGFECIEVADAEKAQTAIAAGVPDLVLLDWMLPGVSGVDLARRLKRDARTRTIPIIMLTARG
ncbi:MAG: response regulator, partial [Gammaproteobacteria bacterium]